MWVLDHLEDLDADFLALYRIDDFGEMFAPRFFSLALRTVAFSGVMAARVAAEKDDASPSSNYGGGEVREVAADQKAFETDPALSGLVSWGSSGG
jgi:hypothetical protein